MSKFRNPAKWRVESPARSNTGTSVRGKTISNPIPFPDDDEFPIRTPGSGIALPLGSDSVQREIQIRESVAAQLDNTAQQTGIAVSDFIDPLAAQARQSPTHFSPEAQRRTKAPTPLRNSVASGNTGGPSGSSLGKPQRKKSSMRSVFGRLFGRKRKGSANSSQERRSAEIRASQHRSDPITLNHNPRGTANSQKRSASLPINEFNRALRSHSIVAEDILKNEDGQAQHRESLPIDGQRRSRRATTPSRLWTPNKTPGYVDWTGLSPRPASTYGRGSKAISDAVADAAIGTAVTSGSHPNRRSRSLGELREIVGSHPAVRRRSDEIRYWRESYDPGMLSPLSSNKAEAEDPILDEVEDQRTEEPQEQPQPFNFGPLGEMAGMKITQAASLETRVQRLEEKMHKMERILTSRGYQGQSEAFHFHDSPRRESASNRSPSATRPTTDTSESSLPKHPRSRETQPRQHLETKPQGSQNRSSSYGSSRPSTVSTHNSYHPSMDPDPPSQSGARPLSTSTTIRGIPSSSPTLPKDTLNMDHYTTLHSLILSEQASRQHLESVVRSLQRQLATVLQNSTPTGTAIAYPMPSSEIEGGEFSTFESDDGFVGGEEEEGEVFRTPNEEGGVFGDEIFGHVGEGKEEGNRTLSLSQITLGRGASVNF